MHQARATFDKQQQRLAIIENGKETLAYSVVCGLAECDAVLEMFGMVRLSDWAAVVDGELWAASVGYM